MVGTQNETGARAAGGRLQGKPQSRRSSVLPTPYSWSTGFTLTELLVVITIIAVLAGLITGAALNALKKANQAAITVELQQLAAAMEDFQNEYGSYPPNVFANGSTQLSLSDPEKRRNAQALVKSLKKAFSRSTEFQINLLGAAPSRGTPADSDNVFAISEQGLSPAEAVVFWLQGFSQDLARPLSGTDLEVTTLEYTNPKTGNAESPVATNVVTIDTRKPRYDFDRGRLRISKDENGDRRFINVTQASGNVVQIQLYEYLPKGSQQPYVYFDVSRETPQQVKTNWVATEFFYSNPDTGGVIFPLKQWRVDTPETPGNRENPWMQYVDYVEKGKFQILHCGIDDFWGDFSNATDGFGGEIDLSTNDQQYVPRLLAPTGPFIGDIADTLGNFMTGTLEDKQE